MSGEKNKKKSFSAIKKIFCQLPSHYELVEIVQHTNWKFYNIPRLSEGNATWTELELCNSQASPTPASNKLTMLTCFYVLLQLVKYF